jgi:CRP-like cAMP-binding protein
LSQESERPIDPYIALRRAEILLRAGENDDLVDEALGTAIELAQNYGFDAWIQLGASLHSERQAAAGELPPTRRVLNSIQDSDTILLLEVAHMTSRAIVAGHRDANGITEAAKSHIRWIANRVSRLDAETLSPLGELQRDEIIAMAAALDTEFADSLVDIQRRWAEAGRSGDAAHVQAVSHAICPKTASHARTGSSQLLWACGLRGVAQRFTGIDSPPLVGQGLGGVFADISSSEIGDLLQHAATQSWGRGEEISTDSLSTPSVTPVVVSGSLLVEAMQGGTARGLFVICGPGDVIGTSLFPAGAHVFGKPQLAAASLELPAFQENINAHRTLMTHNIIELASAVSSLNIEHRLAWLLLHLDKRFGKPSTHGDSIINIQLTVSLLADLLGAKRPRTSTVFNELKTAGLVSTFKRRIVIVDRAGLEQLLADGLSGKAVA